MSDKIMLKPRQKRFLSNLEKTGFNVKKSAVDAGYSPVYADKQGKLIVKSALKAKVKESLELLSPNKENKGVVTREQAKVMMSDLIGLSREELMSTLLKIATQDKDYSSALKVLTPLAKEHAVILSDDEAKTIVPILNIGIRPNPSLESVQSVTEHVSTPVVESGEEGGS